MSDSRNFTNIRSLLGALATSMNLVNPDIEHHHEQTAYLAYMIAREMGMGEECQHLTIYSALLHDIGSVMFRGSPTTAEIEKNAKLIANFGASMIHDLDRFDRIADIIGICQNSYPENLNKSDHISHEDIEIASVVHLADAVSVMINDKKPILNQVKFICSAIENVGDREFSAEAVSAFLQLSKREVHWLDLLLNPQFLMIFTGDIHSVSLDETLVLTELMSRIIDFRSHFTAMHSAGVAASARKLAELAGMSEEECKMMQIAGNLHDVGKLRVPKEILEKPGKLTEEEFNVIKEHAYYTRLILMNIDGFERIANWAGFHHEKLNGNGYPFHFDGNMLDTGSRIMAVADIFSAIAEDRPYRKGMTKEETLDIIHKSVADGSIDGEIAALLEQHYDEVNNARMSASKNAEKRYSETSRT